MARYRKALRFAALPFRVGWFLILLASFLPVAAACVLAVALVGYAIVLTFSYAFLPAETTAFVWQWAAELYARSAWFKAATIAAFVLLVLPILRLWPTKDPIADAAHEREMARLNDDLIASRQRGQI